MVFQKNMRKWMSIRHKAQTACAQAILRGIWNPKLMTTQERQVCRCWITADDCVTGVGGGCPFSEIVVFGYNRVDPIPPPAYAIAFGLGIFWKIVWVRRFGYACIPYTRTQTIFALNPRFIRACLFQAIILWKRFLLMALQKSVKNWRMIGRMIVWLACFLFSSLFVVC